MPKPTGEVVIDPYVAVRLLGLTALGCYLAARDGHIWVEQIHEEPEDDESGVDRAGSGLAMILAAAGIVLNNKIYGGVLEALDTIDEALRLAGASTLASYGESDGSCGYFLGEPCIARDRIDRTRPGEGGIA
jgi:hypothetical protein